MKRMKGVVGGGGPWEAPRSRSRTTTDSRSRPMPAPAPDFAIIGAMKSATSTLHVQLSAVSGVAMSSPKEPCFFSDDEIFARGEAWYDACFAHAGPGDLRGESSTHYTKLPTLPHACERLHRRRPDAKLLYVIRHPVDRLVSHYVHGWTEGWYRGDLERAIDEDTTLVAYGRYAMQLRPWLDRFGPEQVLLVAYDGIRTRPQEELARIGAFLGLSKCPTWVEAREPTNVSANRMRRSRFKSWFVDPAWATALRRAFVPKALRERIRARHQMTSRPELRPERRRRLEEIFDEDLATLSTWLGREIRCGNFTEATLGEPLSWTAATPSPRPVAESMR